MRLIPAPRGTGLVAAPASKKILAMAGLEVQRLRPTTHEAFGSFAAAASTTRNANSLLCTQDCYSTTRGHSRTTGNFITAVFNAVSASYGYLSPELWKPTVDLRRHFQRKVPSSTPKVVESRKFHSLVVLYSGLQQGSVPRTHRLPRQGGRIGQGRRGLLGTRHDTAVLQVGGSPPP